MIGPQVYVITEDGLIDVVMPKTLVATAVKIVPVIAEEGADTVSVTDIQVFACFTEEFTSVTTTTSGATITEKITTKFTSAGTTVTTVIATSTPSPTTGLCLNECSTYLTLLASIETAHS